MNTVEEAYAEIAESIKDFVADRSWEIGVCTCRIYGRMASTTWYLEEGGLRNAKASGWGNSSIDAAGAALLLREDLLKKTGQRIWGLTFTLYPSGKFNIEYDYNKPEHYEETDELISLADAVRELPSSGRGDPSP